jgi:hypothetical protein
MEADAGDESGVNVEEGRIKKVLKSPPVAGLLIGIAAGGVIIWYSIAAWDGHLVMISIPVLVIVLVFDQSRGIMNFISSFGVREPFIIMLALLWYAQYGFFSGIVYWLLRKKMKRHFAIIVLVLILAFSFSMIYALNKLTGY